MRPRFFASFALRTLLPLAPLALAAGMGCEWATEPTPVVREPTWGAELTLVVRGRGRVVSTSEDTGIRCPESCYARIVPNVAIDAAPASITLRATADQGYRFARWEADGARVAGRTNGPAECSPVRRPGETPQLGAAPEITLPFGEVDGYPPPGLSEKCAQYSRVPVAYNLTAVFEPTLGAGDLWVTLPGERAADIKLVGSRALVRAIAPDNRWSVYAIDSTGSADRLRGGINATQYDFTGTHVVWQQQGGGPDGAGLLGLVHSVTGEVIEWSPTPSSPRCIALTSTDRYVYCRTNTQQLVRWTIGSMIQTTILSSVASGAPMTSSLEDVFLVTNVSGDASLRRLLLEPSPALEILAGGLAAPRRLRADTRYVYAAVGTSARASVVRVPRFGDEGLLTLSPNSQLEPVYAVDSTIPNAPVVVIGSLSPNLPTWQIAAYRGSTPAVFRQGLDDVVSIAVDLAHVYWTQIDGRLYRGAR